MLWLRVSAGLIALCIASPAGAGALRDDLPTFGECIQEREQPRVEEMSRAVYRDDAWVPAAAPATLPPEFPGVTRGARGKAARRPEHRTGR
jgi:hypothetical protein